MPGMTDYSAKKTLELQVGKTAFATPTTYIGLFTTMPIDAGTGGVEVSGGSYARVATAGDWNSASGSSPSSITNSALLAFPTATASWGTIVGFGIFDALTGGNLLVFDWLGNFSWSPFTCTSASPGIITAPAHGYANGDSVILASEFGGTLPSGFTAGGVQTVAGITTDTFNIGVNTTTTGNGMVRKTVSQQVPSGVTFQFPISNLQIFGA